MLTNSAILVKQKHIRKLKKGLILIKPLKMKVKVIRRVIDGYLIEDCDANDIVVASGFGYYWADAVNCKAVYRTVTDDNGVETKKIVIVPVEEEGESIDIFPTRRQSPVYYNRTDSANTTEKVNSNNKSKQDDKHNDSGWSTTAKVVGGLAAAAAITTGLLYLFGRNDE